MHLAIVLEAGTVDAMDIGAWEEFLAVNFPKLYLEPRQPRRPTQHLPGTQGKIAVLEARANHEPRPEGLWHYADGNDDGTAAAQEARHRFALLLIGPAEKSSMQRAG